jgi:hypothetical protein
MRLQLLDHHLLLCLDAAHVWDDLDGHGALLLLELQMFALLVHLNDLGYLPNTVGQDALLLSGPFLSSRLAFDDEGADTGEEGQEDLEVVVQELLVRGLVHAELHLLEGVLEV